MILLDTHAFIWMVTRPKKLGVKAVRAIEISNEAGTLAISSCVWLELDMLTERRGTMTPATLAVIHRCAVLRKFIELPVTSEIAKNAGTFSRLHGDPFDLMIAATACVHQATLMTADTVLLSWKHALLRCQDATA